MPYTPSTSLAQPQGRQSPEIQSWLKEKAEYKFHLQREQKEGDRKVGAHTGNEPSRKKKMREEEARLVDMDKQYKHTVDALRPLPALPDGMLGECERADSSSVVPVCFPTFI